MTPDGPAGPAVSPVLPTVELGKLFATFGATEGRGYAPLYERLSTAIAADPGLLGLVAAAPEERRGPVLLFAGVHDLVLAHPDAPLARFYPSVTGSAVPDEDPLPAFRAFVTEHRAELDARLANRTVQTNEVNRCAAVLPALRVAAARAGRPLSLVEVGCSAGLNLCFDRFAYDLGGERAGDAGSGVLVRAEVRGDLRPPPLAPAPEVAARTGIDVAPVDVLDPEAVRWLEACVWPEQPDRLARLRGAVRVVRRDPPEIVAGDVLRVLPAVLAGLPPGTEPVVLHSWALVYLSPADRARFVELLEAAATGGPLTWISIEAPGVAPGVVAPVVAPDAPARERYATVVALTRFEGGARTDLVLARCHPHLSWIEWRDPGSGRRA
ncbi:MAG: DUF2332 domain-containing protein [Acidimicrobiales bacterium]|nr:DUF2332 domain-containing protein [Acidimicrobiales bacterium]